MSTTPATPGEPTTAPEPPRPDAAAQDPAEAVDQAAATVAPEPRPAPRTPPLVRLKHVLLKAIDLTALGFLEPVVRLCYGEEPRVQLRKIGQFVVVPAIAFALFIALWAVLAPHHKTKSGEVPTPGVVADAYADIMRFNQREQAKEAGYLMTGPERERALAETEARLAELAPLRAAAEAELEAARSAEQAMLEERFRPLQDAYESAKAELEAEEERREAEFERQAGEIAGDDAAAKAAFLDRVRAHRRWLEGREAELDLLEAEAKTVLDERFPELVAAQDHLTRIAEEERYLGKLAEKLGEDNRTTKVAEGEARLEQAVAGFEAAAGPALYNHARRVIMTEERLATTTTSTYAKPWTLPMQIVRSVVCVFVGFFIGSLIAIPIGVLCGLSQTFMAAMTPFIALFKPVSPIVWLPIALIVVGGFIPDPDSHWLIQILWEAPLIDWLKINPAFIASAITVALCSLWATMVNTALGVASVDKDHLNVARVLRLGLWQRLVKIILPSALPLVFAGLRISLGVGWMVLIAAELLSSSEGIGKFVWDQFNNGASDSFAKMMVVVFVVGVIGLLLDRIMIIFQRLVSFEGSVAAV